MYQCQIQTTYQETGKPKALFKSITIQTCGHLHKTLGSARRCLENKPPKRGWHVYHADGSELSAHERYVLWSGKINSISSSNSYYSRSPHHTEERKGNKNELEKQHSAVS